MKQSLVVSVAAGDRHSVALTRLGEVYCWGDRMMADIARETTVVNNLPYDANAVDPVREAILNLQWAILSHKDALALKSYESYLSCPRYVRRIPPRTSYGSHSHAMKLFKMG